MALCVLTIGISYYLIKKRFHTKEAPERTLIDAKEISERSVARDIETGLRTSKIPNAMIFTYNVGSYKGIITKMPLMPASKLVTLVGVTIAVSSKCLEEDLRHELVVCLTSHRPMETLALGS